MNPELRLQNGITFSNRIIPKTKQTEGRKNLLVKKIKSLVNNKALTKFEHCE